MHNSVKYNEPISSHHAGGNKFRVRAEKISYIVSRSATVGPTEHYKCKDFSDSAKCVFYDAQNLFLLHASHTSILVLLQLTDIAAYIFWLNWSWSALHTGMPKMYFLK